MMLYREKELEELRLKEKEICYLKMQEEENGNNSEKNKIKSVKDSNKKGKGTSKCKFQIR